MQREAEQELPVRREEGRWPLSLFEEEWPSFAPSLWMRRMREDMDRLISDLWAPAARAEIRPAVWSPTMEIVETEREWVLRFDLPGVEAEDVDVSCSDNTLRVSAETRREEERRERGFFRSERRYGAFQRTCQLPRGALLDQIRATYRNGVLEIHVPKSEEARERVRRIPIEAVQPALAGVKGGEAPPQAPPPRQAGGAPQP